MTKRHHIFVRMCEVRHIPSQLIAASVVVNCMAETHVQAQKLLFLGYKSSIFISALIISTTRYVETFLWLNNFVNQ